jgi:hypothetical protein
MNKARKMRWKGRITRVGKERNRCRFPVGNGEEKRPRKA